MGEKEDRNNKKLCCVMMLKLLSCRLMCMAPADSRSVFDSCVLWKSNISYDVQLV